MSPRKQQWAFSAALLAGRAGGGQLPPVLLFPLPLAFLASCPFVGQEMMTVSPSTCSSEPPTRQLGRAEDRA